MLVASGLVVAVSGIAAVASFLQSPKHVVSVASPTPAPDAVHFTVRSLQVPPSDRPLIWFREADSFAPLVLRATDWTGRVVGRLAVSCSTCEVLDSPDGQRLLIGNQYTPELAAISDHVFDSAGHALTAVDGYEAQWADDSRHLCALRTTSTLNSPEADAAVDVIDATHGSVRTVARARAGADPSHAGTWSLLRCAIKADRAVLTYSYQGVRALRVVRISTGATVLSRDGGESGGAPPTVENLVVSGDASLAVENLTPIGIRVIDLGSGRESDVSASWIGLGPLLSLSWHGRSAVTPLGVYTFPAGTALWRAPLPAYMLPVAIQPRSDDVLLSLWVSSAPSGRPVIVHGDGHSEELPTSYLAQPPLPF